MTIHIPIDYGRDVNLGMSFRVLLTRHPLLSRDLVFIEPKRKLPPEGARTLKGRRKKEEGKEKEERKESDEE
jgi:hypothetical protein